MVCNSFEFARLKLHLSHCGNKTSKRAIQFKMVELTATKFDRAVRILCIEWYDFPST